MHGFLENGTAGCAQGGGSAVVVATTPNKPCADSGTAMRRPGAGGGVQRILAFASLTFVLLASLTGEARSFSLFGGSSSDQPSGAASAVVPEPVSPPRPVIGQLQAPAPSSFDTSPPAVLSTTGSVPQYGQTPAPAPATGVKPAPSPAASVPSPLQSAAAEVSPPQAAPPPASPTASTSEAPALLRTVAPPPASPQPTTILTLRGSNTIGWELAPKLAQAFLAYIGDAEVAIVRHKDAPDDVTVIGRQADRQEAIFIAAHGSATAFKGLAADKPEESADIGMASRQVNAEERELLKVKGDMTSAANEHVLGLDGIATVVNRQNAITTLTTRQLRDIFSGAVTDWGDRSIGGPPGAIHLYARDSNSGTYDTFASLVLKGAKLRADAQRFEDSTALSAAVDKDPTGIGFIGLPYVGSTKALAVSEAGALPIKPNRLTVATEDYALARRLYLYTPTTSANPAVRRFIEFVLSPSGQKLVDETGFIALTIGSETVVPPADAPPQYQTLIKGSERLSTNFRFKSGVVDLDNRAQRDTRRLADFLVSRRISPNRLILVGFGDNVGTPAAVKKISEERAKTVARELALEGIAVGQIAGFGALLPVADNETEQGRGKNRRVEVFVRP